MSGGSPLVLPPRVPYGETRAGKDTYGRKKGSVKGTRPTSAPSQKSPQRPRRASVSGGTTPAATSAGPRMRAAKGRDAMLQQLTQRFLKTKHLLHQRKLHIFSLTEECERYKRELESLEGKLQEEEQRDGRMRGERDEVKRLLTEETAQKRALEEELTRVRKEKALAQKERDAKEQDYRSAQYSFKRAYQEHVRLEEQAKQLSQRLEETNKERLAMKQKCEENQLTIDDCTKKLADLKDELAQMHVVVFGSLGDSLSIPPARVSAPRISQADSGRPEGS